METKPASNGTEGKAGWETGGAVEPALDAKRVAELLRMNTETVRKMAASGQLPAHRLGRRFRFFWSEVRARLGAGEKLKS